MATAFIEDAVQGCLDLLAAQLPAALAAVSAKYAAADVTRGELVPLPPPSKYLFGQHLYTGFGRPFLQAYSDEIAVTTEGQTNAGHSWGMYSLPFTIEVILESDDVTVVSRQESRYAEAIYNVIDLGRDLSGVAMTTHLVRARRLPREPNDLIRTLLWECTAELEVEQ